MAILAQDSLIQRIKSGDPPDAEAIQYLTSTSMKDFVSEAVADYPHLFQERQVGRKRELGLARSCHALLRWRLRRKSVFPVAYLTPVFKDCLFIVGENDRITGVSTLTRLAFRPAKKPRRYALSSGTGFHCLLDLEEWRIKPVVRKTTILSEETLRKHGWRFDVPFGKPSPVPQLS
jgi:hypothetical protein